MLLPSLVQDSESISGSVVPLAMFENVLSLSKKILWIPRTKKGGWGMKWGGMERWVIGARTLERQEMEPFFNSMDNFTLKTNHCQEVRFFILVIFQPNLLVNLEINISSGKGSLIAMIYPMEENFQTDCLIVENKNLAPTFFVLCPAPLGLAKALDVCELLIHRRFCLSPPWGFSNVLHCPRTLGETFKRKVEHFNTLQKVLAIAGGKCTPLKNGKTFILDISAKLLTHVWLLILPNNFFCWYIVHQIHQILIQQNFPHIHHYHTRIALFTRFTIWLTLADSSHLWHF